jgi:hypothetical protein
VSPQSGRPAPRVLVASLIFVALAVLALVLQRSLLARLPFTQPDLLALVVASGALARGPRVAAIWGLLAGLLADLAPPAAGVAGLWTFAYATAGFAMSLLVRAERRGGRDPFRRSPQGPRRSRPRVVHGFAAAAATVIATVVHLAGVALIGQGTPVDLSSSLVVLSVGAAYVFVLGLVLGRPLTRLLAPTEGVAW